jgi:hypothetical protein
LVTNSRNYNHEKGPLTIPDALKAIIKNTAQEHIRAVKQKNQRAGVLIEAASEHRRCIKAAEEKKRKALYSAMRDALELLCLAVTRREIRAQVRIAAKEADIPETKGTPMALLVAKLCIGAEEATASQQAQALNGALLKEISPDEFAAHLKGEGIAKLAAYFREQRGGGNDRSGGGSSQPATPIAVPMFDFSDLALRKLRKAEDEGALEITMAASRTDDGGWLVDTVKISASEER